MTKVPKFKVNGVVSWGVLFGEIVEIHIYGSGEIHYIIQLDEKFKSLDKQRYKVNEDHPRLKVHL